MVAESWKGGTHPCISRCQYCFCTQVNFAAQLSQTIWIPNFFFKQSRSGNIQGFDKNFLFEFVYVRQGCFGFKCGFTHKMSLLCCIMYVEFSDQWGRFSLLCCRREFVVFLVVIAWWMFPRWCDNVDSLVGASRWSCMFFDERVRFQPSLFNLSSVKNAYSVGCSSVAQLDEVLGISKRFLSFQRVLQTQI